MVSLFLVDPNLGIGIGFAIFLIFSYASTWWPF